MRSSLRFPLAICWLLIVTVLFFLPGSALPKSGLFDAIQFDKWVHFGIFFLLVLLWGNALQLQPQARNRWLWLWTVAVLYGLLVEIGQDKLVTNRSFDLWDLLADAVGAATGVGVGIKINPCGNRGRNQN